MSEPDRSGSPQSNTTMRTASSLLFAKKSASSHRIRIRSDRDHDYDRDPYFYSAPIYRYHRGHRYYETNQHRGGRGSDRRAPFLSTE